MNEKKNSRKMLVERKSHAALVLIQKLISATVLEDSMTCLVTAFDYKTKFFVYY